jgi:hypothetical protein
MNSTRNKISGGVVALAAVLVTLMSLVPPAHAQTVTINVNGTLGPNLNGGPDCLDWNGASFSLQATVSTSAPNTTPDSSTSATYEIAAGGVTGTFGTTNFTSASTWKIKYTLGKTDSLTLSGDGPSDASITASASLLGGSIPSSVLGSSGSPADLQNALLTDFSSGSMKGWKLTGADKWFVNQGCTDSNPSICPPSGESYFALSGLPNTESETYTGVATSPTYTVAFDTFSWYAYGWAGSSYNGESYYRIVDTNGNVKAQIAAPESNTAVLLTTNLISDGLTPGQEFHFQGVDGDSAGSYAWLAMGELAEGGTAELTSPKSYLSYKASACESTTKLGSSGALTTD